MTTATPQQFSRAQAVRLERARLRRQLKEGSLSFAQALAHPAMATMLVFDLLMALPSAKKRALLGARSGYSTDIPKAQCLAQSLFAHIQRGPLTRVQDLTPRERDILVYAYLNHTYGR